MSDASTRGLRKCPPCNGTGKRFGIDCFVCKGEGEIARPGPEEVLCNGCYGKGVTESGNNYCFKCKGRGYRVPNYESGNVAPQMDKATVFFIQAGKPDTAHLTIEELLVSLTDTDLRICDPYYGTGTLARLAPIGNKSVHLLTKTPDSKEQAGGVLARRVKEFQTEYPTVEFRQHVGTDLHDRYVVTASEFILLGHGLKDPGNKDSFIVRLPRDAAGDMIDSLITSFDDKWSKAVVI